MGNNPVTETGNLPTLCRRRNRIFGSSFSRHPSIAIIFRVCSSKLMNFFFAFLISAVTQNQPNERFLIASISHAQINLSKYKNDHISHPQWTKMRQKDGARSRRGWEKKVVKPKSERAAMSLNFWWFVFLRGAWKRQEEAKSLSESDTILSLNKILSSKRGL
jgi:hypothetical protein